MCYQNKSRSTLAFQLEDELDDCLAGAFIQIAGGLVCHQNCRIWSYGSGQRDSLLLSP
jgi:hypothetical protein